MKRWWISILVLLGLWLLTSGSVQADLRFLLPPVSSPNLMNAAFTPLTKYLEQVTGQTVHLSFSADIHQFYVKAQRHRAQLVLFCPVAYLRIAHLQVYHPLAGLVPPPGGQDSVIVVRKHSAIRNVLDLRGRTFAMGNTACAASNLVPFSLLQEVGISARDFRQLRPAGTDNNALLDVVTRFYDATAVPANEAEPFLRNGSLRSIARIPVGPGDLIAASGGVSPALQARVSHALLALGTRPSPLLSPLAPLTQGFVAVPAGTYAPLRALYRDLSGQAIPPLAKRQALRLGIPPAYTPLVAAELFRPLQNALSQAMGQPVAITVPRTETAYVQELRSGYLNFALLSPLMATAVQHQASASAVAWLRAGAGSAGVAVVQPTGRALATSTPLRVAFSSPYCSARSVIWSRLQKTFAGHRWVWQPIDSERGIFAALALGQADVGIVRATTVQQLDQETPGTWKTLVSAGPAPSWLLVAAGRLPAARRGQIDTQLRRLTPSALGQMGFQQLQLQG